MPGDNEFEELKRRVTELEREKKYLEAQNEVLQKENQKLSFSFNLRAVAASAGRHAFDYGVRPVLVLGRFVSYGVAGPLAFAARHIIKTDTVNETYDDAVILPYIGTTILCAAFWGAAILGDNVIKNDRLEAELAQTLQQVPCLSQGQTPDSRVKCDNIFLDSRSVSPIFRKDLGDFIIERTQETTTRPIVNTDGKRGTVVCRVETTQMNQIRENDVLNGEVVTHPQLCSFQP
jgi:hypothetical protein